MGGGGGSRPFQTTHTVRKNPYKKGEFFCIYNIFELIPSPPQKLSLNIGGVGGGGGGKLLPVRIGERDNVCNAGEVNINILLSLYCYSQRL